MGTPNTEERSMDASAGSTTGNMRPGIVTLSPTMEIGDAEKFHEKLKKSASRGADVNLSAENIEVIDSTILQLLLSFVLEIRSNGNKVSWLSPSDALLKAAELTGLTTELGLVENNATS